MTQISDEDVQRAIDAYCATSSDNMRDMMRNALQSLRSKPLAGVEVPLEWKENSHTSVWTGELAFGVYYVAWDEGTGWRAFRKQFLSEASEVEIAYGDKATVLAAAESDYRNRIMSAITYSVEPVASGQSYDAISKVVHECRNRQRQTGESDQMLSRWITEALSALLPKATAPVVSEPVANRGEQRTICEACGNSNLAHDRAVWTDDGSSFCPSCAPQPEAVTGGAKAQWPTLKEAYQAAVNAAQAFDDAANVEETNWTGWGEQTVPASAIMRRVKAGQALKALRDADPCMRATFEAALKEA